MPDRPPALLLVEREDGWEVLADLRAGQVLPFGAYVYEPDVEELRTALRELHRAVTEDDGSDADEARLRDAVQRAQRLAPHVPEPPSKW